jgi:para-aminobenzoate synthetase / 4-amino-4-deoxychorismate lyase
MPRRLPSGPFVLLDDARMVGSAPARVYTNPVEILTTRDQAEIPAMIARLGEGHWAGFISYEAGLALEPRLEQHDRSPDLPLLWFGRFDAILELGADEVTALLPSPEGAWAGRPRPEISRADYGQALAKVQSYITAGDIYQANLTFPNAVTVAGDPVALYAGLRDRAKAGYGGIVWTGEDWLLSLSPELFFALHGGKITTKPMKGTAVRRRDPVADAASAQDLQTDPKQRAENLMIVDLLRNDLSRIADAGSVAVPHLFTVESYPTVHQMTSTVTAQVKSGIGVGDILRSIYPCGSITGAPKIRAMEIIAEVEPHPRGAYTGSIGRVDASGDAAFNVAIRTLHLRAGETTAMLGLGSGIVADSRVDEEWAECIAKGRFVADRRIFDLIETMRFEPDVGIVLLDHHLARMKASAAALDFVFDRHAARNELQAASFRLLNACKIRMLLARSGAMAIESAPLPDVSPLTVALRPLPVAATDFRLRHKTTDRRFYDDARTSCGADEVVFVSDGGFVTEGSFTSVFVPQEDNLLTPPLASGLIPGVLRADLIASGRAREAPVHQSQLRGGFLLGNAVRGLFPATLVST